jgi:hypothetical protein
MYGSWDKTKKKEDRDVLTFLTWLLENNNQAIDEQMMAICTEVERNSLEKGWESVCYKYGKQSTCIQKTASKKHWL